MSNVLNNPDIVAKRTREKVDAAIAELGYLPNDAARSLAAGTSTSVGLVVADLGNSLFVDIARGAGEVLRAEGFHLLIANADVDEQQEISSLEVFERARVAGILLAPLDHPIIRAGELPTTATPLVLVNAPFPGQHASVSVDERSGGRMAAEHLLGLGRSSLIFVGGPLALTAVSERLAGAREAVAAVAGAAGMDVIETATLNIPDGRRAAEEIIARGPGRYDGIVAASDLLAVGLIERLTQAGGFRVPQDVAVTGYDDNHFASDSWIPVTTIGQPGEDMGRAAARLLVERVRAETRLSPSTVLQPHLIVRQSTVGG